MKFTARACLETWANLSRTQSDEEAYGLYLGNCNRSDSNSVSDSGSLVDLPLPVRARGMAMISEERLRELWLESGAVTGGAITFARAVEAEARREALEEAAKVADTYEPRCDICPSGCANAIRAALAGEKP